MAECPQLQAALRFPSVHNSDKSQFFVERDVCRLRCLQITRLASRIRAINHWSQKGLADPGALGLRGDTHNHDIPMGERDIPMLSHSAAVT